MTNPDEGRRDDTFDKFFRPAKNDEITDPGVPSAAYAEHPTQQAQPPAAAGAQYYQQPTQGSGYVEQPQYDDEPQREGSILLPLLIIGVSLAVLAVVGILYLNGKQDTGTPSNAATSTSSTEPSNGSSGSTSTSGSTSGSTSSSTSSTTSSSSSIAATLPAGTDKHCGDATFSTSPNVSCEFAKSVASQARAIQPGGNQQVGARSAATGKQYVFDCNHPDGSFITCVGTAQPDDGRRPTVYVLPS